MSATRGSQDEAHIKGNVSEFNGRHASVSEVMSRHEREIGNHSLYQTVNALYKPATPAHKPPCPKYLRRGEGAGIWNEVLDSLEDSPLLPTLVVQLEVYIDIYLQWKRTKRIIEREGHFEEYEDYDKKRDKTIMRRRPHELTGHMRMLWVDLGRQYRHMFFTFASRRGDVPLGQKLEAVHKRVSEESGRGDLIGGRLAAA